MALTSAAAIDRAERLYITGGDRTVSECNNNNNNLVKIYYYRRESMSSRRKVLLKVIILGDSG